MKVYVLTNDRWEENEIEAVFAERADAEAYIRDTLTAEHARAISLAERRRVVAERWVAAGGGLSRPVREPESLEVWLADHVGAYRIEEFEVQ